MCGIAGFFSQKEREPETIAAMMAALKNRGPDSMHSVRWQLDGTRSEFSASRALIHARLSIIDPRPISDQPMVSNDGQVWICYNGEVYDWSRHAEELKSRGAVFKTRSDTEFILHAYQHWGIDMLTRLRGMFAIAILDSSKQKFWLVRDRMGLKPIVYSHFDGDFAFGSTVRSVLPFLPKNQRDWNPAGIDAYLAHRYIPAPQTVFKNIQRLPNAHWLSYDLRTRQTQTQCYWQPSREVSSQPIPRDEWLSTLDTAISIRTVADRPLGVFLSSGIDSSTIASRLVEQGYPSVNSFTASFDQPAMDESPLASKIADTLGFQKNIIPITMNISDEIDQIIADLDEPFADPSSLPTWYLSRVTTQHVKVVLGGDGGDEMLAGYKRFAKHQRNSWRRWLPGAQSRPKSGQISGGKLSKLLDEARMDWRHAYSLRFSGFTPSQRAALQPYLKQYQAVHWRGLETLDSAHPLKALLEIDRLNYLPEYILRKGDLCTMAHGLELRAPLLDHEWVSLVSRMPDSQRFTHPAKLLFQSAMPKLESLHLFEAKKKGFNPPLNTWLESDLVSRLDPMPKLLQELSQGQIVTTASAELLSLYRTGRRHHAEQLLQLLFLQISLSQLNELRIRHP
jgi:asparagine synthase (glutamine-hydrolysing)